MSKTSDYYEEQARGLLLSGKPGEALSLFEEGLRKYPEDAGLLLGRGMALLDLKRPAEARALFVSLTHRHPRLGDAYQGWADACLALGLREEAVAAVRRACGPEEKSAEFIHCLGHLLFRHKLYDAAKECYRRAIEIDSSHGHSWVGMAACFHRQGRRDEAIRLLKDAVDDCLPGFWEAYSYLGCLLFDAGRTDEAQTLLHKIPLDELGDPGAAERLRALLDVEAHPERALVLAQIEARARARIDDASSRKVPPSDSTADWKPHMPFPERFWQGDPTLVTRTSSGQDLEQIFAQTFQKPCTFDGEDAPKFIRRVDASLCEAVIELLAEFLEAYPWREHLGGTPRDWWRESGAESLMSYTLAILRETKRGLREKTIAKSKSQRLIAALDKVWPTLPDPSRTYSILLLLWMETGARGLLFRRSKLKRSARGTAPTIGESPPADAEHPAGPEPLSDPSRQPKLPQPRREPYQGTFVIGPVYGNLSGLKILLRHAKLIDTNGHWRRRNARLVIAGPILSEDGKGVDALRYLTDLKRHDPADPGKIEIVLSPSDALALRGMGEAISSDWRWATQAGDHLVTAGGVRPEVMTVHNKPRGGYGPYRPTLMMVLVKSLREEEIGGISSHDWEPECPCPQIFSYDGPPGVSGLEKGMFVGLNSGLQGSERFYYVRAYGYGEKPRSIEVPPEYGRRRPGNVALVIAVPLRLNWVLVDDTDMRAGHGVYFHHAATGDAIIAFADGYPDMERHTNRHEITVYLRRDRPQPLGPLIINGKEVAPPLMAWEQVVAEIKDAVEYYFSDSDDPGVRAFRRTRRYRGHVLNGIGG